MFFEIPENPILLIVGAFLIGWLLSSISSSIGSRTRATKRDPRDDRIRSLVAEHRIAQTDAASLKETVIGLEKLIEEAKADVEKRDNVISQQQIKMSELSADLKESVKKTRELRAELSERATQSIKSEVKLREVETELEVAQASTDMIATGVLDYSLAPEVEEANDQHVDLLDESDMTKAAT
jgi:chromosome segregation ATPase